ncbi:MAG: ParB/RepB/Spo0J family partition protein [Porphyromonadaceae bacterium]|nr:ParB/RepB/Spo0J family partition protein [Porphyromonadaceae bacterium]
MAKTKGLGRGLGALIEMDTVNVSGSSSINEIEINLITPNPNQPRQQFDEESLAELASSIRELGVISPITLRANEDGTYLIIAGERRYRAARDIGLKTIPAYIRTAADDQVMEMALIENIQREDLNAVEIALTFFRLMKDYNLTQDRLSERVGKKRATISNYLRLLHLPAEIQMGLKNKLIDMGHARAILGVPQAPMQLKLYQLILKNEYSVRQIEELVRLYAETGSFEKKAKEKAPVLEEISDLKSRLSEIFSTKVQLTCNDKGKGRITIPFANDEELVKIMKLMDRIDL